MAAPPNTYPAPVVHTQRSGFYPLVTKAIVGFLNRLWAGPK